MGNLENILTPAIISIVITSMVAPLLFYYLKHRDDVNRKNFDVRYAEYQKYLRILDEIAQVSRVNFEEKFLQDMTSYYERILNDPSNIKDAFSELNVSITKLMSQISQTVTKSKGELNGLRLVCSDKLLIMVDEFVNLQSELLDSSTSILNDWQNLLPQFANNPNEITERLKAKSVSSELLRKDILNQMREELKIK